MGYHDWNESNSITFKYNHRFKIPPSASLSHLGFDDIVERWRHNSKHLRLNKIIWVI